MRIHPTAFPAALAVLLALGGCAGGPSLPSHIDDGGDFRIAGNVQSAEDVPAAGAVIEISQDDFYVKLATDAEGKYSVTVDHDGDYVVTVDPDSLPSTLQVDAADLRKVGHIGPGGRTVVNFFLSD